MSGELARGYTCPCGTYHQFPMWMYAHWDLQTNHTCECGNINHLWRGEITHTILADEPAPQPAGEKG